MYSGLNEEMAGIESDFSSVTLESDMETGKFFKEEIATETRSTFQLKRKYIVSPIKSGIVIIDQHRAHQRVLYEGFLKNITVEKGVSQQLIFPLELSFSTTDVAIVQDIQESLEQVGFMFKKVEKDIIAISGVPIMVAESEVQLILEQLINDVQQEISEDSFSQTDLLSKALCKSLAVKTGEKLQAEAQEALVNDLFACKEPMVSPFHKTIYITTAVDELDKKFI